MTEGKTFTVKEDKESKVYHGFNKRLDPIDVNLAIYEIEGEIEIFSLDDPNNLADLPKFLFEQREGMGITFIGVFTKRH